MEGSGSQDIGSGVWQLVLSTSCQTIRLYVRLTGAFPGLSQILSGDIWFTDLVGWVRFLSLKRRVAQSVERRIPNPKVASSSLVSSAYTYIYLIFLLFLLLTYNPPLLAKQCQMSVLSCPALPCPALPCPALPCPALPLGPLLFYGYQDIGPPCIKGPSLVLKGPPLY